MGAGLGGQEATGENDRHEACHQTHGREAKDERRRSSASGGSQRIAYWGSD
jgi:hypothetical protein